MIRHKTDDEKQTSRIGFTCTKDEEATIRALAKAHGINQHSVFVRLASLGIIQVDRSKIGLAAVQPVSTPAKSGDSNLADLDVDSLGQASAATPVQYPWDIPHGKDKQAEVERLKKALPVLTMKNFHKETKSLEIWERKLARTDVMSSEEQQKLDAQEEVARLKRAAEDEAYLAAKAAKKDEDEEKDDDD